MTDVVILVGVPGSGKTTFAEKFKDDPTVLHLSSDNIRKELYGDLKAGNTDEANTQVFLAMHERLHKAVKEGEYDQVIYDATNTSRKRRRGLYKAIKSYDKYAAVLIVYFSIPLQVLLKRNKERERETMVPSSVIQRMYVNMQVPRLGVDCDTYLVRSIPMFTKDFNPLEVTNVLDVVEEATEDTLDELNDLFREHDCPPHHYETVDEHINMCIEAAGDDRLLKLIAVFHDLGKSITREYNIEGKASFKNHANVGANYLLNFDANTGLELYTQKEFHDVMEAIHQHMNRHQGMGDKNIKNNILDSHVIRLLDCFVEIDDKSRITEPLA